MIDSLLLITIYILCVHFVADYVVQTRWQANNKAKNHMALVTHAMTYTVVLHLASIPVLGMEAALLFALLNGLAHVFVDSITSRMSTYAYLKMTALSAGTYLKGKYEKMFWVTLGFDQLLHLVILVATLEGLT